MRGNPAGREAAPHVISQEVKSLKNKFSNHSVVSAKGGLLDGNMIVPGRQKAPRLTRQHRKTIWAALFLLPWFVFFCIFTVYPFVFGIYVSFTNFSLAGVQNIHFVGLDNFKAILDDPAFVRSIIATISFAAIIIPCTIVFSLWIANILQRYGNKMNALTKVAVYLPAVTCQAALVVVWKFIFAPHAGVVAGLLKTAGLPLFSLFDSAVTSIPVLSLIVITATLGQPLILYSAAINNIPVTYYEAAELDGASRMQQFFQITLPLLQSANTFVIITTTIGVMQVFVVPYLMTSGGPQYTTSTLLLMIYKSAFQNGSFGYASAVGLVLFLITAVIAAFQFRIMRRDLVEY